MDDSEKLDRMFGMLHEMRPVVLDIREDQKAMDIRMRATEILGAEHGVKIRALEAKPAAASSEPGRWATIAEFLGALPTYAHFAMSIGGVVLAALAVAFRLHKP